MTTHSINHMTPSTNSKVSFLQVAIHICDQLAPLSGNAKGTTLRLPNDYRQSLQALEEEFELLRVLKGRLVGLLRSNRWDKETHVMLAQMIYQVLAQTKEVWRVCMRNWPNSNRESKQSREIVIPLDMKDCLQKHAALIARHMKIINEAGSIVRTAIPEDYAYDNESELIFATVYGYLPAYNDPILASEELEAIADDFDLVMFDDA